MAGGWIAQGADQPALAGAAAPTDPWQPIAPDSASVPALVRPHQQPAAHPLDNSRSLFTKGKDLLFGHEPENAQDPDQAHQAGVLPALGEGVKAANEWDTKFASGPDVATLAAAYPKVLGANLSKIKAGYQETVGANQYQTAERQMAALNVLPQVAARVGAGAGNADSVPGMDLGADAANAAKIAQIAQDPAVKKAAIGLGLSPQDLAGDWNKYAGMTAAQQADAMAHAKDLMERGRTNSTTGANTRAQARVNARTALWQSGLDAARSGDDGTLDPATAKGIAFNAALGIPELAAVAGVGMAGTAVAGPVGGIAAGGATAAALFAPAQREDVKDKIDDQVLNLHRQADALDASARVGSKRGLNPASEQLRQQAADLAASSDKIANTAGLLYAVGDAAGAVPVSAVLSRSPVGKAMLDRMVGAAAGRTVGGRIAGAMVANGAGGMLQAAIQQAVDAGIVHEDTSLKDALKDIAYTGVTAAVTALPVAGLHEAFAGRRSADTSSPEFLDRVRASTTDYSSSIPAGLLAGETQPPSGETTAPTPATNGPSGATNEAVSETPLAGMAGKRQAFEEKTSALNDAAAAAEKRSDVTLEPEEQGWSVHVKGQPVAQFDTVEAAREAMAQARKVVGTKPAAKSNDTIGQESVDSGNVQPPAAQSARTPETALERTQPLAQSERRSDTALRTRVSDMSPEQLRSALLTHELTGMPNRRAYEDSEKLPVQVSADSDGLKAINDVGGHAAGDQALKAVAAAMQAEAPDRSYHISGDEFTAQAHTEDEAHDLMVRVNQRLSDAVVEVTMPDGKIFHLKGLGVSYGVGKDLHEADGNLQGSKTQREAEGLRAPRGVLPPGATVRPGEAGRPSHGREVAGEPGQAQGLTAGGGGVSKKTFKVLGQDVQAPHKPTPQQASAGNYFKPTVKWHGLPIKVENLKGQKRRYLDAKTGKPGTRTMQADYGYIPGTKGNDEDGVDIMMGPHHDAPNAYVIDQLDHTGKTFDEHKIQVGVRSAAEAKEQYLSHYPEKWKGLGGITEVSPQQLKRWLSEGDLTQPMAHDSVPAAKTVRSGSANSRHDSVLEYLARHPRGLDSQEAAAHGIDKADMGLAVAKVGIRRAFRNGGMSFDQAAEHLRGEGYPVSDEQGHYSPNVLLDRIDDELRGRKHFSSHNESRLPQQEETPSWKQVRADDWRMPLSDEELKDLTPTQARTRLEALRAEQERLEREIERAGMAEPSEHESAEELDNIPFMRGKAPGSQMDLFGAVNNVKNDIKKLEAVLDEKRNSGQESVETGRPDDLFSQSRQQADIEDKPAIPPNVKGGALEDAGEKIGGARKDRWAEHGMKLSDLSSMSEGEAAELVNKKAVWNPDWQKLVAGGMDKKTAAVGKILIDQLAARPRVNTPEGRRHYVEVLGRVRDMILEAKSPGDLNGLQMRLTQALGMPTGYAIASTPEQQVARAKFWSIQKGRRSSLVVAHSDLRKAAEMLEKGWPAKAVKEPVEGPKAKPEKEEPKRPHLDHIDRVGPPVRRGDVASTDFVKDFGFRGLEFGNWAANDERQRLLNFAYEGLHDLARALNLPPQALSLNGTLGLALGARGGGRGAAHYESGKLVINMTKINGAGALAHEWGHALDHYMGELGRADAYTTGPRGATGWRGDRRDLAHLRPELQEAWNGVMEAMYRKQQPAAEFIRDRELNLEKLQSRRDTETDPARKAFYADRVQAEEAHLAELRSDPRVSYSAGPSAYVRESARLGQYWRRPTEMFARAFEGFVQDKIAAEGNTSEYLVHHAAGLGYPGEDRPQVNAAIQRLVDAFETQGDKSALFQRTSPPEGGWGHAFQHLPVTMSPEEIQGDVGKILKSFSVKPDVVIARDLAELKRDPALRSVLADTQDGDVIAFVHGGKIYLVANRFHGPSDVASAIAHEYITHYGLRAAFGNRQNFKYQAILDGVARAMPAEMRARGEQEFPNGFNPLNQHQRNVAAEEALAYYGQRYAQDQSVPWQLRRWLDKLHAMLRDWIRSVLGLPKKFDELFVKRTLADLEAFLRNSKSKYFNEAGAESPEISKPAFANQEDTFFSALAKAVDGAKRGKGAGAEWEATLRNMPGVRDDELKWTGLKDWLDGRGRVSKAEVAEYVNAHRVTLGEVLKGGGNEQRPLSEDELETFNARLEKHGLPRLGPIERDFFRRGGADTRNLLDAYDMDGIDVSDILDFPHESTQPTKYSQYVSPGGQNYRELLLTLPRARNFTPGKDSYQTPHWMEPDVLAHIRFDDRTGSQGERVLHLAEVQSDWHQQGRRQGYATPATEERRAQIRERLKGIDAEMATAIRGGGEWHGLLVEKGTLEDELTGSHETKVPAAPFKTTWPELAMKRMLRYAAEHGYDALSWDTGAVNAERYNLAKRIKSLHLIDNSSGGIGNARLEGEFQGGHLTGRDHSGNAVLQQYVDGPQHLADTVGKEIAERLLNAPVRRVRSAGIGFRERALEGQQIEIGGEGMKAFYDKMLPAAVGKLVKKWGGSVDQTALPGAENQIGNWEYLGPGYDASELLDILKKNPAMTVSVRDQIKDVRLKMLGGMPFREAVEGYGSHSMAETIGGRFVDRPKPLDAHMVRITPALRDSVMQGQPMFLKRRKGSTGTPAPAPKKGAYALARRAVAAIPNSEFALSLRRIADPAGVSPPARATALVTREALGELAQASEEALQNLERYAKTFDLLGTQDRYDFIHSMETGAPQANTDLQPAADAIRKLLDVWREQIRGLGTGALDNFIENYFPHIWADDAKAKKVFAQIFGKRPLKGPASFLKERTIPTTKEGLEAGLVPISTNPLILAFAKLREMQRFYTGVKLMQRFKDEGLARFFPSFRPIEDGWTKIDDAVGRVRQWSETEQGFVERGFYAMPTDAARVINNHLSASALRNFLPAQIFRSMSNAANALQLGFSAFHLGFTTLDAVISKNALGIERLLHGEPLRAAAAFLEASTGLGAAGLNIMRGRALLRAYSNIAGATPEMRRIVEGLMAAGGRIKMDNYFQAARGVSPFKGVGFANLAREVRAALTQPTDKLMSAAKVMGGFPREYATRLMHDLQDIWAQEPIKVLPITSALEIAGRATRASTSIIMEHVVPLQKLGVFSDLAADHIRRNPLEDPVAFGAAMQAIWNSVDNRLGEMVYDNVFWQRTFKDVLHMMIRAVGWNLGTVREIFGAPFDAVKALDYMARGAPPEIEGESLGKTSQARKDYEEQKARLQRVAEKIGHKIPYTLALVGTTMILGAALQYLFTGEAPKEIKDYFFPRTGRLNKNGSAERISLPSYIKDIYEYGTQPVTTVMNKANPLFGIIHAIYANEDFFGNAVRDPDAGFWRQALQGAQYAAREVLPFSLQGAKQYAGAGTQDFKGKALTAMPYVGLGPAPARVTAPEQMERYQMEEKEKSYIRGLQRRLKSALQQNDVKAADELREEIRAHKLTERGTEHEIRHDKVKATAAAKKIADLVTGRSRPDAVAALRQAGLPAFAELWNSMPERPKPRIAASLENFA